MYDVVLLSSIFNEAKIAEPLGICYLAAVLRQRGFSVRIVEPSVEGWTVADTAKAVLETPSRLIGISIHRDVHKKDVLEFLKLVRAQAKDRFICIGGHAPSVGLMKERTFSTEYTKIRYSELGRYADAFMIGESENSFPELVARILAVQEWRTVPGVAYLKEDGAYGITPPGHKIEDLDTVPFMARDVLEQYLEKYGPPLPASLSFGRGCLYECNFCTVSGYENLQAGIRHRQRSAENVITEIKYLHEKYGIDEFNFEDDNFIIRNNQGIRKVHALCDAILQLDFRISFTLFCRSEVADENLFSRLKQAGLTAIFLGIESVFESDLEFFHKGCKLTQIREALDTFVRLGYSPAAGSPLRLKVGYITWHPLSTFAQLRASGEFIRGYNMPPKLLGRKLRLYTGIPIRSQIEELGLLDKASEEGWKYKNPCLRLLQQSVEKYFQQIHGIRDKLRTLEKVAGRYYRKDIPLLDITRIRTELDVRCLDFFDHVVGIGEVNTGGKLERALSEFETSQSAQLASLLDETGIGKRADAIMAMLDLPQSSIEMFRK